MAIELSIKHGDIAAENKDFLGAVGHYSEALKENPEAFLALVKRAVTYTKLCNYDDAKRDITKAFEVAQKRGRRNDIGVCYYRLALVFYAEKDFEAALVNFRKAKEYQCAEPALDIWLAKAERDAKKAGTAVDTRPEQKPVASSTSVETINKSAPLKTKIRDDWYQDNDTITVTIYAKGVKEETLKVEFEPRKVAVCFPGSDSSEYNYNLDPLYDEIDVHKSKYKVYSTKLEIALSKVQGRKWPSLEGDGAAEANVALEYPSSSKKAVNWSNFKLDDDDENPENFFAKLYKDVDDDTRRAMMKSYVESNGTVLTTNWSEAKDKKFETSPPEGMEAKKWN
ncbi:SGS domain family protein [Clavispora lusitaniae]|uniref:Uncharacterized protein n=1 Tax=Clavispora lusitaniae (strain ATCC 42720) TaxID=306902 RepID=C4Y2T6_CLAL4|nr:uncharacterized protein CLUG_02849 [Clavispora lusitaniae ATCC 42720]EEQ38723.1 hypothetical protein CLUG_02849 [Clavispora lusitaniae ATCC 42720]KAF7579900.1 SGS domain family protein [Clavispora lusitaniae]